MKMENEKTIKATLGYYGNRDYGKRVFWVDQRTYVWGQDFIEWAKEMKSQGYTIEVTNPDEVRKDILEAIK